MAVTLREVVTDVVAGTAPHELAVLDSFAALDDRLVTDVLMRRTVRRDPIAFGVTEVTVLITPVVWLAVAEVVKRGTGIVADGMFARLGRLVRRLLRRTSDTPRVVVPPLTSQQLELVHQRVRERATAAGINGATSEHLADAVVSRLARAANGSDPGLGTAGQSDHGR